MIELFRRFRPPVLSEPRPGPQSASRTAVGHIRSINEDRLLDRSDLGLWAVADGMGGQSRGDLAAEIAISHLVNLTPQVEASEVAAAIESANQQIFQMSAGQSGTTLVVLLIDGVKATVFWAGDSRAYLIRGGRLHQITRDHSLVQQLVDAGLVDPKDAADHPQSNIVTRALGTAPHVELETRTVALVPGDQFLLCSDGFSRTLTDGDLVEGSSVVSQVDRLLAQSLLRDGSDNTSLIAVQI